MVILDVRFLALLLWTSQQMGGPFKIAIIRHSWIFLQVINMSTRNPLVGLRRPARHNYKIKITSALIAVLNSVVMETVGAAQMAILFTKFALVINHLSYS